MSDSSRDFKNSNDYGSELFSRLNDRDNAFKNSNKKLNDKEYKEKIKNEKDLATLKQSLERKAREEEFEQRKKDAKYLADERIANAKAEGDIITATYEEIKESLTTGLNETLESVGNITKKLDDVMAGFVEKQQSMASHLIGTGVTLNDITNNLNSVLSAQGMVRQEAVYSKLSDLLNKGIVYNVEQRAFLQTLSEDMNLLFDASNGSLTRLIRLQSTDLTSYRMAIQYDLQKFLNENYSTSEYIREAFTDVSSSILEAQSLMSVSSGIQLESTLQTILGSYYSLGASSNTITSLAQAVNALGSGDISNLGNGISNLLLMGVAQSGLDYGSLLNNGVSANQLSTILNSTIGYMSDMYYNSDSNVVKSQLAKIFGVTVSDLVAASKTPSIYGGVSADINNLLGEYYDLVPASNQVKNFFDNMLYAWGTNIASNPTAFMSYEIEKLVANTLGDALKGYAPGGINLGYIAKAAPLLTLVPTLLETVGNVFSSGQYSTFDLTGIYEAIGNGSKSSTIKISDAGVSGSMYMSSGDSTDILNSSMNSVSGLAGDTFTGTEEEDETWKDDVSLIRENIINMYDVLQTIADDLIYNSVRY